MCEYRCATEDGMLVVYFTGRLDSASVPGIEGPIVQMMEDGTDVVFDCDAVDYISSAGLRLLLLCRKRLSNNKLYVRNVSEDVMEVFEVTGFTDILLVSRRKER